MKHINLFARQTSHQSALRFINTYRKVALQIVLGIIICAIVIGIVNLYYQNKVKTASTRQEQYVRFVKSNTVLDTKLRAFLFRNAQLKKSLRDDNNVSKFYYLLESAIQDIDSSATIGTFMLEPDAHTTFKIQFRDYERALAFLSKMEQLHFLDIFSSLELKQFTIRKETGGLNVLEFSGTFTPIQDASRAR